MFLLITFVNGLLSCSNPTREFIQSTETVDRSAEPWFYLRSCFKAFHCLRLMSVICQTWSWSSIFMYCPCFFLLKLLRSRRLLRIGDCENKLLRNPFFLPITSSLFNAKYGSWHPVDGLYFFFFVTFKSSLKYSWGFSCDSVCVRTQLELTSMARLCIFIVLTDSTG